MEGETEPGAVRHIKQEHRGLVAEIEILCECAQAVHRSGARSDFSKLRAELIRLAERTVREHQASEDQLLFPLIAARCPVLVPVLRRLQADHVQGELTVKGLHRALAAWESAGVQRDKSFDVLLRAFTESHLGHMEVEETYVLPVAMDYLSQVDWQLLELALCRHDR